MNAVAGGILNLIYPPNCSCLACDRPLRLGESIMCVKCAVSLEPIKGRRCRVCSRPLITDGELINGVCGDCRRRSLDQRLFGIAPLLHEGVAARLIYALKYMHIRAAAEPLAQSMLDVLPEGFDALVPVPLYHKREQTRGYNQAAVLCDELSRLSGRPVLNALNRTRATHQQMRLAADKRKANVKDAFEAIMPVNGKRLVVVDDVRTTGATALACADALYLGGAVETRLLTATLAIMGDSSDHRYETKDAVVERTTTSATRFDIHGLAAPLY